MLRELDLVREAAVHRAIDPISLEDLRIKSNEVGALVWSGHRVEPALYHRSSVVGANGSLLLHESLSPVTPHELVDGFRLVPALCDLREFIQFIDWDEDGWVSISEVAVVLAAILPVDEDGAETFVRDHFDVDQDGCITCQALEHHILPYCGESLANLLRAAPVVRPPELRRGASRAELLQWFRHWEARHGDSLEALDLRFAVATALYRALGSSADTPTKETVASLFLAEAGISSDGLVSSEDFLALFAPALQANMPESQAQDAPAEKTAELRVTVHAPVDGIVVSLALLPSDGDLEAALQEGLEQEWPMQGRTALYLGGVPLDGLAKARELRRSLGSGAVVQVLPARAAAAPGCVLS